MDKQDTKLEFSVLFFNLLVFITLRVCGINLNFLGLFIKRFQNIIKEREIKDMNLNLQALEDYEWK